MEDGQRGEAAGGQGEQLERVCVDDDSMEVSYVAEGLIRRGDLVRMGEARRQ